MKIQFTDLKAQHRRIEADVRSRIERVLKHGQFIMGPEVTELEKALSDFVGAPHVIGCASGTDALLLPLMAYDLKPGDAVFTTPFTFIATAEVVSLLGATPIFVDVDPKTYNLDPVKLHQAVQAAKKSGRYRLRGVIPVDLFGLPADYDAIHDIADASDLFVLEDAAQSLGATFRGKNAGTLGHIAATSFFPSKPLGCYGDGGAVFTDDAEIAAKIRSLRVHGQGTHKYDNVRLGLNARLDTMQAAVLLAKLEIFAEEIALRQKVAARYDEALKDIVQIPFVPQDTRHAWAQYSILTDNRDQLAASLKAAGVPTMIYYPRPLHLQTAYQSLGYRAGDLPVSENLAERILSLPFHPYLAAEEQDFVVDQVRDTLVKG